jgi:hypothetical protein
MTATGARTVLAPTPEDKIRAAFPRARWTGPSARAHCPAHDDRRESLSIRVEPDGKILIYCHAHCAIVDILAKVDLTQADLFPSNGNGNGHKNGNGHRPAPALRIVATYDYNDAEGHLLYQEVRFEPKDFRLRRPDGSGGWTWKLDGVERVPYRLPELLAADPDEWVFIPEGPRDVENVVALGPTATTNAGGAGKWDPTFARHFRGRKVAVLCDNDGAGYAGGLKIAGSLYGLTRRLVLIDFGELPEHADVSDWLALGHDEGDLLARAELAEDWRPVVDPCADRIAALEAKLAETEALLAAKCEEIHVIDEIAGRPDWRDSRKINAIVTSRLLANPPKDSELAPEVADQLAAAGLPAEDVEGAHEYTLGLLAWNAGRRAPDKPGAKVRADTLGEDIAAFAASGGIVKIVAPVRDPGTGRKEGNVMFLKGRGRTRGEILACISRAEATIDVRPTPRPRKDPDICRNCGALHTLTVCSACGDDNAKDPAPAGPAPYTKFPYRVGGEEGEDVPRSYVPSSGKSRVGAEPAVEPVAAVPLQPPLMPPREPKPAEWWGSLRL